MASTSIKDVAARSGVSYKTVSRVINSEGPVREETRQRVLQAIRELDYRPLPMARNLRRGRAQSLRLVLHQREQRFLINPFQDELISGIVDTARRANYAIVLDSIDPTDDPDFVRTRFLDRSVDGNVLLDSRIPFPFTDVLIASGVPATVTANRDLDPAIGWVDADFAAGGRAIVQHLIDLGHRRIAHIHDDLSLHSTEERVRGYREALDAADIPFDPALLVYAGQLRQEGSAATQWLLDQGISFSAVYCVNDLTAFGAIETLTRNGLRVPEDVSVTGYDDLDYAQYVVPSLTTVHIPWYEMGAAATQAVLDAIEGRRSEPIRETFPVELRIRESTGPVR